MQALKELWTPTSRTYTRADEGNPKARVWNGSIAWQNYRDQAGGWQKISLRRDASRLAGFQHSFSRLPFKVELGDNGRRRVYPDRNDLSRYVDMPVTPFLAGKTFAWDAPTHTLAWRSPSYDILIRVETSKLILDVVVKGPIPFDRIVFDVDEVGCDATPYLNSLRTRDSSPRPQERPLAVTRKPGQVEIGFDLTGMVFPVVIDPTLDLQVGAGADDTRTYSTSWDNTGTNEFGNYSSAAMEASARFTGVSGLSGQTIDTSYVTYDRYDVDVGSGILMKVQAEDAEAPAAPSSFADFGGRSLTTAGADWDFTAGAGDSQSPSINSVIQELADSYDPSVIQIFLKDDGSTVGAYHRMASYDSSGNAPKLYIEHSSPTTFIPRVTVI